MEEVKTESYVFSSGVGDRAEMPYHLPDPNALEYLTVKEKEIVVEEMSHEVPRDEPPNEPIHDSNAQDEKVLSDSTSKYGSSFHEVGLGEGGICNPKKLSYFSKQVFSSSVGQIEGEEESPIPGCLGDRLEIRQKSSHDGDESIPMATSAFKSIEDAGNRLGNSPPQTPISRQPLESGLQGPDGRDNRKFLKHQESKVCFFLGIGQDEGGNSKLLEKYLKHKQNYDDEGKMSSSGENAGGFSFSSSFSKQNNASSSDDSLWHDAAFNGPHSKKITTQRFKILRLIALIINTSTLSYHLAYIYSPQSDKQREQYLAFSVVNIFLYLVLFWTYLGKASSKKYVFHIYIYLILRLMLRMLDFEETRDKMKPSVWGIMMVVQYAVILTMIVFYFNMFQNSKSNTIFGYVLMLALQVSLIYSFIDFDDMPQTEEAVYSAIFVFSTVVYYLLWAAVFNFLNIQTFSYLKKSLDFQEEFQLIFNNLKEPLFLLGDGKLELVNRSFVKMFYPIIDLLASSQSGSESQKMADLQKQLMTAARLKERSTYEQLWVQMQIQVREVLAIFKRDPNLDDKLKQDEELAPIIEDMAELQKSQLQGFLDLKMFKEYKPDIEFDKAPSPAPNEDHDDPVFSINSFQQMTFQDLEDKKFVMLDAAAIHTHNGLAPHPYSSSTAKREELEEESGAEAMAPCIKVQIIDYLSEDCQKSIIQFIDMSTEVKQDRYKAQTQLLEMINACVSHELRNPLNSVMAINIEKQAIYAQIKEISHRLLEATANEGEGVEEGDNGGKAELTERVSAASSPRNKLEATVIAEASLLQEAIHHLHSGMRVQESSAHLMQFMIQDLLDYAQIKAGKFRKNISRFDFRKTLETVAMVQQKKAQVQGIELRTEIIGDEYIIETDEERVMQVLLGLQSNALKFTLQGSVTLLGEVRTCPDTGQKRAYFSVVDTGEGIEPEHQAKLFKLFGFIDKKNLNTKGIGLGLVISQQIVQQFGGTITFKSVPGEGSAFTFHFVLEGPTISDTEREAGVRQLNSTELVLQQSAVKNAPGLFYSFNLRSRQSIVGRIQPKILVVDDQPYNLEALEILLTHVVKVDTAKMVDSVTSGKDALDLISSDITNHGNLGCSYELILMDCNMPFMSGYEATSMIRKLFLEHGLPQPVISAVTGHSEQYYVDKCFESGMNQVLSKPVKGDILKALVSKLGFV